MPSPAAAPVAPEERIPLLDALRGFALCGILIINIKGFSGFGYMLDAFPDAAARLGPGTGAAQFLTRFLVEGKFYSIFSFLFGLGFSIQLARGEGRPDWLRVYARRLRILFLIGVLHAFLLWSGDILWLYAALGFALLPFRHVRPRAILIWAFALLLAPIPFYAACYLVAPGFNTDDLIPTPIDLPTVVRIYATSSYPVILGLNLEDWLFVTKYRFFTGRAFRVLGMFLLGLWVGRMGVLHKPEQHAKLLTSVLWVGLAVGLACSLTAALFPSSYTLTLQGVYATAADALGSHPLALAYVAAFALLWRNASAQRILSCFVPMGRMALTNYLMQTVLGVTLYYGYGLGWFGRMPTLVTMLVVVPSILLAQMTLSTWWLRRFRYGPMEWLWRQATYQRRLSLRLVPAPKPTGTAA